MKRLKLVIVACGNKKQDCTARARDMYTGEYFKACFAYAQTLAPDQFIMILSAKYGLIGLHRLIEPYNIKMGDKESISEDLVKKQVDYYELLNRDVIVVGGAKYVDLCRTIWPDLQAPLNGKGGIGEQMKWIKESIDEIKP